MARIFTVATLTPIIPVTESYSLYKTKTAKLLEQIFGPTKLISEFDNKRLKLKMFPTYHMYLSEYNDIVARLEVVVLNMYEDQKDKLTTLEKTQFLNSSSLNIVVKDDQYADIIHKLKILQLIKTELQI